MDDREQLSREIGYFDDVDAAAEVAQVLVEVGIVKSDDAGQSEEDGQSALTSPDFRPFGLRFLHEARSFGLGPAYPLEQRTCALAMVLRATQHGVDLRVALFLVQREPLSALLTWQDALL